MCMKLNALFHKALSWLLVAVFVFCSSPVSYCSAKTRKLDENQRNAIAMLNYINVLSQEIDASKNSRLFMEEAYSILLNNTDLNAIDENTYSQVTRLLNTIEEYRMIDTKRDRLRFIYEQNQAQAIHAAMPNPLGLLSAVKSANPADLVASIVYMAIDSYSSYSRFTAEDDLQYLRDGWSLDNEEAKNLHENRMGTLNYTRRMCVDYNIPPELALRENTIIEFANCRNDENDDARIRFLTRNASTYQLYGGYWLLLAQSYYNKKAYDKVLDSIKNYLDMDLHLFIKDYELARMLPLAIRAAEEYLDDKAYVKLAADYAQRILDNTDNDNWALRYYTAQVYLTIFDKSNDSAYLRKAYDIALDNVTYLRVTQLAMNRTYLNPIKDEIVPTDAGPDMRTLIENINKQKKEKRKTELPPVYEPLLLNCELLFALEQKVELSEEEREEVDNIIHPNNAPLFLTKAVDNKYHFAAKPNSMVEETETIFEGYYMVLPVEFTTQSSSVAIRIVEPNHKTPKVYNDWKIEKVERKKEGEIATYQVVYTSAEAFEHHWIPGSKITIEILPVEGIDLNPTQIVYNAEGTKNAWYDYLKPWEGHKNNWYEYAFVWENSVIFEREQ